MISKMVTFLKLHNGKSVRIEKNIKFVKTRPCKHSVRFSLLIGYNFL